MKRFIFLALAISLSGGHAIIYPQQLRPSTTSPLRDEVNAQLVLKPEQIATTQALPVSEIFRRHAPQLLLKTWGGRPNFALYLDGMQIEANFLDQLEVRHISRIVVWRSNDAPICYRTSGERFVTVIETRKGLE